MKIELAKDELEIDDRETVEELIEQAKEELSSTRERLVGIKIDGKFLNQTELEEKLGSELTEFEIELVTETVDELTMELVDNALTYLDGLSEWTDDFAYLNEGDVLSQVEDEEIEELLEGLHWLNLAVEELAATNETETLLGGRSVPKFMSENRMFLNEIQGALEKPEENKQLMTTLILQDLPTWIDEYRDIFLDFRGGEGSGYDG
nr:hypothetical protein [Candidatus Bipolaricaulota bacterium]